jgi:isopenicillin N synthase-like dioxygenase
MTTRVDIPTVDIPTVDIPTVDIPTVDIPTVDIPTLDLAAARGPDGAFRPAFLDQLRTAAHDVGFFQLTSYGAAPGQAEELFDTVNRFFALPEADRLALDNRRSPHFRGYTRLGHEITAGRPDAREQLDFAAERPAVPDGPGVESFWTLQGPNLWPESFPELRSTVLAWCDLLAGVGVELQHALAVCMDLPEDYFDGYFAEAPAWFGKLVHYVGGVVAEAGDQGVGPHKDYGFVTLLLQDTSGGLQARPNGTSEWLDIPPTPGALVVNLGEMLEIATHGFLTATVHRVLSPAAGTHRISIPFFWSPRLDAVVDPVPMTARIAGQAGGVTADPNNALLPRFGDNALKGWLRAHPDVARAHHPDLVGA